MNLQKQKPWRSKKYLSYIRSLPCCVSGQTENIQAHHIIACGLGGTMGCKVDDFYVIPLASHIHSELHNDPELFEINHGRQLNLWRQTIAEAIRSGGLNVFDRWVDGLK